MPLLQFREITSVTASMRADDLKAIDNALAAYKTSRAGPLKDRALAVLHNLVGQWERNHPASDTSRGVEGRRQGIGQLKAQLALQPQILAGLTPALGTPTVGPTRSAGEEVAAKGGTGAALTDLAHGSVDTGIGIADTAFKRAGPAIEGGYVERATANSAQLNSNVGQSQAVGGAVQGLMMVKGIADGVSLAGQSAETDVGKSNLNAKRAGAAHATANGALGLAGNALSANGNFAGVAGQQMAGAVLADTVVGAGMMVKDIHDAYHAAKGSSAMGDIAAATKNRKSEALGTAGSAPGDLVQLELAEHFAQVDLATLDTQLRDTRASLLLLETTAAHSGKRADVLALYAAQNKVKELEQKKSVAELELVMAQDSVRQKQSADQVAAVKIARFLLLHELHLSGGLIHKNAAGAPQQVQLSDGTPLAQEAARQEYQQLRTDGPLVHYLKATRVEEIRAYSKTKLTTKAVVSAVDAAGQALDVVGTFTAAADLGATKAVGKAVKVGVAVSKAVLTGVSRADKVEELGKLKTLIDGKERGLGWRAEHWLMHDIDNELAKVRGMLEGKYIDAAHQGKYQAHVEHLRDDGQKYERQEVEDLKFARNERYANELVALALKEAANAGAAEEANAQAILSGLGIEAPQNFAALRPAAQKEARQAMREKYLRAISL